MTKQIRLSDLLAYDESCASGLRWIANTGRSKSGKPAGTLNRKCGYYYVGVGGKRLLAHRIVWALHHGECAEGMDIDHVDMNGSNNRIENLRLASRAENHRNRKVRPDNKSGVKGLSMHPSGWVGRIQIEGKVYRKFSISRQVVEEWIMSMRPQLHGAFARQS